jgi:Grx4 family monothiol glutaredoxin
MTTQITTAEEFQAASSGGKPTVCFFWASFHEPSKAGGQMDVVFSRLAATYKQIRFSKIEAEALPDIAEKFAVAVVPTFIFLRGGTEVNKVEGANVPALAKACEEFSKTAAPTSASNAEPMEDRLKALINTSHCMIFIKGTPSEPRCGFSRKATAMLTEHGVKFSSFDILTDEAVRQGLKTYSNWPTFPQLYVDGNLVGGLDIMNEMAEDGDLKEALGVKEEVEVGTESIFNTKSLTDRLKELVNSAPVFLCMKGDKDEPKCGFSKKMVAMLQKSKIEFCTFDILADEEIRQELKTFSNWPTYPQLYVKGQFTGGLDIVTEILEDAGEDGLAEALGIEA